MSETITVEIDKDQYNKLRDVKGNKKAIIEFLDDAVNKTFELSIGSFVRSFNGIEPFSVPGRWYKDTDEVDGLSVDRETSEAFVKVAKFIEEHWND